MEWYQISNADQLDTPALVVYPDRVKENIRLAVKMVGDAAFLRPHVKTHKSPEITRLMLEAGIRSFKCATIAEAEMLAMEGAPDVLLAYQPIGPKAVRFAALIRKYPGTKFACLIDNLAAAAAMSEVFAAAGLSVPVWIDLNVGMDRTGIVPGPEALQLYKDALKLKGIVPVGLHAYDGHIRDSDLVERTRNCDAGFAKVVALRDAIEAWSDFGGEGDGVSGGSRGAGFVLPIIAGGSPTFPIHSRRAGIQCSPGTFVYWDKGYGDSFKEQPFSAAALVVTRVISLRGDTRLCLDLGHKSIAPENELKNRVFFLNGPQLIPVGQSEEHLVVEAGADHGYQIGDIFYGVPIHVCPTVAQYERAFSIENHLVTGFFKNTARDRFLTV
ncbi:MAG TPA: D-TA family PLP-dependent enzyme [Puia sp.]|jgi:D-serine deaminase-like pyridoxal phosphate-dependent protein